MLYGVYLSVYVVTIDTDMINCSNPISSRLQEGDKIWQERRPVPRKAVATNKVTW